MIYRYENRLPKGSAFPAEVQAYLVRGPRRDGFPANGYNAERGDSVCVRIGKRRRVRRIKGFRVESLAELGDPRLPSTLWIVF